MIDKQRVIDQLIIVQTERSILKKQQASLRVKECRLKKLLIDIDQLELFEETKCVNDSK